MPPKKKRTASRKAPFAEPKNANIENKVPLQVNANRNQDMEPPTNNTRTQRVRSRSQKKLDESMKSATSDTKDQPSPAVL